MDLGGFLILASLRLRIHEQIATDVHGYRNEQRIDDSIYQFDESGSRLQSTIGYQFPNSSVAGKIILFFFFLFFIPLLQNYFFRPARGH